MVIAEGAGFFTRIDACENHAVTFVVEQSERK
jgi:hypothetical protein